MNMNDSYLTTSYDSIFDHVYVFLVEKYHLQLLLKPFMVVDPTSSPGEISTVDSYIHFHTFLFKTHQAFCNDASSTVSNQEITRK